MSTPCGHKKNTETVAQYRKRCGGRPLGMIMKMSEGDDKVELIKLYNKAMKMMPGSPNQKKIKKQISALRKKLKMDETPRKPQTKQESVMKYCRHDECAKVAKHFYTISEKKDEPKRDKCYHKVKARYDVWPSAYASAALTKCRQVGADVWGEKSKKDEARGTCWVGYKQVGMKDKNGKKVPNCVKEITEIFWEEDGKGHGYTFEYLRTNELNEAEYQGRKVKLGKPSTGDVKKFKVYVKNPKGNVVKVNFGHKGKGGEKTMRIKKSNPDARKSFRARHNCDNPGPRHKARYWSCRKW